MLHTKGAGSGVSQAELEVLQNQLTQKDTELQQKTQQLNAIEGKLLSDIDVMYITRVTTTGTGSDGKVTVSSKFDKNEFTVLNNGTNKVSLQANKNIHLTLVNASTSSGSSGYFAASKRNAQNQIEGTKKFYAGYLTSNQGVGVVTEFLYAKAMFTLSLKVGESIELTEPFAYSGSQSFELLFGIKEL